MASARTIVQRCLAWVGIGLVACWLAACGGDEGEVNAQAQSYRFNAPLSDDEAARFLTQASFGPTEASIQRVRQLGYKGWINEQLGKVPASSTVASWVAQDAEMKKLGLSYGASPNEVTHSFWRGAIAGDDQLRQRVAFALSEIFVVSWAESCPAENPKGLASYYDVLLDNAFSDFRKLLEKVALHPIMGCYLSHLRNERENPRTGRVPDENFAREVMQLFTIGLHQLDATGRILNGVNGQPLETFNESDITGLARVFTGFSFSCPARPADGCFYWGNVSGEANERMWLDSMQSYPQFHSRSEKAFLRSQGQASGPAVLIPAEQSATPNADTNLRTALDALAGHPNVGPFIGKQLIQRLVTSNPSAEYVGRVSKAFELRRNLGDMVLAILLDDEARDPANMVRDDFGKVREPILRVTAFLRAIGCTSITGHYLIDPTDDAATALGQSPLKAPSVFNFFRPGYTAPTIALARPGMVAPEMQIVNESTSAAYVNYMKHLIEVGPGRGGWIPTPQARSDIQLSYADVNGKPATGNVWYSLANQASASPLIEHINHTLFYGAMPEALKAEIKAAVESVAAPKIDYEVKRRLWSTLLLAVASPEFMVQR